MTVAILKNNAVQIAANGGPEVLEFKQLDVPSGLAPGEILVKNFVAGVNFIDTNVRKGAMPAKLPLTVGMEGAGVVEKVGEGVTDFVPGDKAAYVGVNLHSYAQYTIISATKAVKIPASVSFDAAAASMMQGLTAHYLLTDCYPVKKGDTILVHAGAGGVGQLLTQVAAAKGATVITTVGSDAKAEISRARGAKHVVNYEKEGWEKEIEEITGGRGVNAVYDSIGKNTFPSSLHLLRTRGHLVLFGAASGAPDAIPPLSLGPKSITLIRPMLFHYIEDTQEYRNRAREVFEWVEQGVVAFEYVRFPLSKAREAHEALEGRKTVGKILLEVEHDA
ncbi:quinone oxidoreductase [Fimicolochytrium jonesii]|uniref:quinone oxidoreductase n=1 Tax=Fimicolochytrium jonesii TaxID=1396493 RepID=UPI0022FEB71A|nr:quinone oxidoreductase [Fimicolochytrium jonesii]KAI8818326.1 quinone oxidoreductase [Fimicolochytrium jonesii]